MRGVHRAAVGKTASVQGSSPHARGPPGHRCEWPSVLGIIPACAGSTRYPAPIRPNHQDHPRMRGVHLVKLTWLHVLKGSSPHARGPQYTQERKKGNNRIIPACAGSTRIWKRLCVGIEDHPRMRGVHSILSPVKDGNRGSSPHARGPRSLLFENLRCARIIPACAGST